MRGGLVESRKKKLGRADSPAHTGRREGTRKSLWLEANPLPAATVEPAVAHTLLPKSNCTGRVARLVLAGSWGGGLAYRDPPRTVTQLSAPFRRGAQRRQGCSRTDPGEGPQLTTREARRKPAYYTGGKEEARADEIGGPDLEPIPTSYSRWQGGGRG